MAVMEIKKVQQQAAKPQAAASSSSFRPGRVGEFIGDVKAEVQKVTWTSKEELQLYTKLVVGATFAMGLGMYLVDLSVQSVLATMGILINWLIG